MVLETLAAHGSPAVFFPDKLRGDVPDFRITKSDLPAGVLEFGNLDDAGHDRFQIYAEDSEAVAEFFDASLRDALGKLSSGWKIEARGGRMICWRPPPARGSLEDVLTEAIEIRRLVREAAPLNSDDAAAKQFVQITCPMCGAEGNARETNCRNCGEDLSS